MAIIVISSVLVLSGCGAMGTAIKKRNLDVKTQMSETIWLEPSNNHTVFLQIKNTSDKDMSGLQAKIASAVTAKGYQVVTNPDTAGYWIQANVLKADKMDLRESQGWLSKGYEGAATAAALGAGITAYNSNSAGATLGVGLAAGLVGMAADAMVEDVNYTMVTDVQIAERTSTKVQTDNVAVGFAPIFPDTFYHLTHYWPAAADIPVASDNPAHYADAIRYNARTPLQGSLLPLTRLVWA